MRQLRADLHLHTCLSPCAELEMVPTAIVKQAKSIGLDAIAICDHNSAENVGAVLRAGQRENLAIIPGMEVTTREEVHILGLFGDEKQVMRLQERVYENLAGENDPDVFGFQVVVDEFDNVVDCTPKLLIGATSFSLEETVSAIHDCGGLAIAAHIDRERFGLVGQLGFIPEGLPLDGVELSPYAPFDSWGDFPVVRSSDAHSLNDIGKTSTCFRIEQVTLSEIAMAFRGEQGRMVVRG